MTDKLKLNLGCGGDYIEGFVNVDQYADHKVDARYDVAKIPYDDNTVDEIRAFHVIEHFHFLDGQKVLKEWCRVLKPGGRLHLETPDFLESCKEFINQTEEGRVHLYGHFFSTAWIPGQTHLFLFTETQLRAQLEWAGFGTVNRLPPSSGYLTHYPAYIFLNVEAFKPL